MAAANAYRALSVNFKVTSLLGITDVSITDGSSAVDLITDASPTVTAVFIDSIVSEITATTTDVAGASAWHPGDTGALVIVFQKRAEGSGNTASPKTATFATATLVSSAPKAGTNGVGAVELTFRASGPAGTTPLVWS